MRDKKTNMEKQNNNWYVLYTSPRAEKQVRDKIMARGIKCWLPLHKSPRIWSDRIKIVEMPLYSSYVFVYCQEVQLRELLLVYGVSRIIYYNEKPASIRQEEIDAIENFLKQAEGRQLYIGEEVEILCGAMKHVSGKIKKIKKNHLVLHVEQIEATICVKLEDVAHKKRL